MDGVKEHRILIDLVTLPVNGLKKALGGPSAVATTRVVHIVPVHHFGFRT